MTLTADDNLAISTLAIATAGFLTLLVLAYEVRKIGSFNVRMIHMDAKHEELMHRYHQYKHHKNKH